MVSLRNGYNFTWELGFGPMNDDMIRWVLDPRRYSFYIYFWFFCFFTCKKIYKYLYIYKYQKYH